MRTTVAVLALLLTSSALAAPFQRDAPSALRWHEDLSYLKRELPRRHINAFHDLSREEFERMTSDLDARVESLRDSEIIVGIARIVAHLGPGDGHSRVNLLNDEIGFHKLPLNLYSYSDGLFVRASSTDYAGLLGARVIAIDGVPAQEAFARALEITAGDNAMTRRSGAANLLASPEVLRALGIGTADPSAPVVVEVETPGHERKTVAVQPLQSLEKVEWQDIRRRAGTIPMYFRWAALDPFARHGAQKNFWYEYLAEPKVLYVNFSEVSDAREETVAAFFARVYAFADAHSIEKFVIDIRNNGGGNNYLNRPIIYGLISRAATLGRPGTLFVIIGRDTFSAAQNLANELDNHTEAIFVGEPTGGRPNHYGDALRMRLPNSKLSIQLSSVWWQDLDPRDFRPWIAPQVTAESSSEDDRLGRDPAMDAVLAYATEPALADRVRTALERGGKAEALRTLEAWRAEPRHKYASIEGNLRSLGLQLFAEKKTADAVTVFELNAQTNPSSWMALNNLGRAYAAADRKADALAAFNRALLLRPNAPETLTAIDGLR